MTTKSEMETLITEQAETINKLTEQLKGARSNSISGVIRDAIAPMEWSVDRGWYEDNGREVHDYFNFGPMLLVSQMAFPVGKQRFKARQDWEQLSAKKTKLEAVFTPEDMADYWQDRDEQQLQRAAAALDSCNELEDQLLQVIRDLGCPQWDEDAHLERVEEYARADLAKRDARRAANATGEKAA